MQQGWEAARSVLTGLAVTHKAVKGLNANAGSFAVIDPLGDAFLGEDPGHGPAPLDLDAIAREGLELRLTVAALNAGCLRYVTQTGAMVEQDGTTPAPGEPRPGVVEGLLASSSVLMIFARGPSATTSASTAACCRTSPWRRPSRSALSMSTRSWRMNSSVRLRRWTARRRTCSRSRCVPRCM